MEVGRRAYQKLKRGRKYFSQKDCNAEKKKERKDQATKSIGRMPRLQAPKKDVAGCEKLRGAASELRSADIRMRELTCWESMYVCMNR